MKKWFALAAVGVLLVFAAVGLVSFTEAPIKATALMVLCAAGITGLYLLDRARERDEARRTAERHEARFRELSALARSTPGFELVVHGSSQSLLTLLCVGVGAGILYVGASHVIATAIGAFVLLVGLVLVPLTFPTIGRPKLVLTREGFRTPLTPFIPWERVTGVSLEATRYHDRVLSHALYFRVPTMPQLMSQLGFAHRLLYRLRTTVGRRRFFVTLKNTNEPPEVIHRLARTLWTTRTGRDEDWDPVGESASEKFLVRVGGSRWFTIASAAFMLIYFALQIYRLWGD